MAITENLQLKAILNIPSNVTKLNQDIRNLQNQISPIRIDAAISEASIVRAKRQLQDLAAQAKSIDTAGITTRSNSGVGRRIFLLSLLRICPLLSTGDSVRAA